LARVWRLLRPYWFSEDRWPGRGLLLLIIALTLGSVWLTVLVAQWNRRFFDALQEKTTLLSTRAIRGGEWSVGLRKEHVVPRARRHLAVRVGDGVEAERQALYALLQERLPGLTMISRSPTAPPWRSFIADD
jgi:hypothetical protein